MKIIPPWRELYEADGEENESGFSSFSSNKYMQDEIDELRAEVARIPALEKAVNFQDAVACVFDSLKFAAANTRSKAWDDQLEELAQDVIEYSPEYKKQWKDIGDLCKKLAAAEQKSTELLAALVKLREDAYNAYADSTCDKAFALADAAIAKAKEV